MSLPHGASAAISVTGLHESYLLHGEAMERKLAQTVRSVGRVSKMKIRVGEVLWPLSLKGVPSIQAFHGSACIFLSLGLEVSTQMGLGLRQKQRQGKI